jgi:hypothetical protein
MKKEQRHQISSKNFRGITLTISNQKPIWENILPQNAPRIYVGDKWVTTDEYIQNDNKSNSPLRRIVYILFTSQYLNVTSKEKYDLFSIEVLVFDGILILKDMHLLKLNVHEMDLKKVLRYSHNNTYLESKDKGSIYYLGVINSYSGLTRNILQITKGSSSLFTLGDDWLLEAPKKFNSSTDKYRAENL